MNVTTLKTIGLEDFVEYNLLKEVVIFYKITNVPLFFLLEKATKYKEWNCSYSSDILFKGLDCINKNNEKISPFIAREYESIYDYYRQTKSEVAYERLINNLPIGFTVDIECVANYQTLKIIYKDKEKNIGIYWKIFYNWVDKLEKACYIIEE